MSWRGDTSGISGWIRDLESRRERAKRGVVEGIAAAGLVLKEEVVRAAEDVAPEMIGSAALATVEITAVREDRVEGSVTLDESARTTDLGSSRLLGYAAFPGTEIAMQRAFDDAVRRRLA